MTTPKIMSTPHINQSALDEEIRKMSVSATSADILTRSQARLDTSEHERVRLESERRDVRVEIDKTKENLANLQNYLSRLEANEADINIELGAVLVTIHSLREAGVELPK